MARSGIIELSNIFEAKAFSENTWSECSLEVNEIKFAGVTQKDMCKIKIPMSKTRWTTTTIGKSGKGYFVDSRTFSGMLLLEVVSFVFVR